MYKMISNSNPIFNYRINKVNDCIPESPALADIRLSAKVVTNEKRPPDQRMATRMALISI